MILQVDNITKSFASHVVLNGISLHVDAGEIVGLMGANGAGKTTLLRIITGLLVPDSGRIMYEDHPIAISDFDHIGYLPEERGLYRHMSVIEQALYFTQLKGMSLCDAKTSLQQWFTRLGMEGWEHLQTGKLSKGMQQRLQFVITVAHNPKLLILDEPFSGFDANNASHFKNEIARLRDNGTAILFSTHNQQAASELCNRIVNL